MFNDENDGLDRDDGGPIWNRWAWRALLAAVVLVALAVVARGL